MTKEMNTVEIAASFATFYLIIQKLVGTVGNIIQDKSKKVCDLSRDRGGMGRKQSHGLNKIHFY